MQGSDGWICRSRKFPPYWIEPLRPSPSIPAKHPGAPAMRIGILVSPRVQLLDVAGPADVFVEAARQLGDPRAYRVQLIGTEAGVIQSSSGPRLQVDASIADHRGRLDTLLVAGGPHIASIAGREDLQRWLQRQAKVVRRIGSVCTGTFVL